MSKYNALWEYIRENGKDSYTLTFDQIQEIAHTPLDHSFLKYKKELLEYGYQVKKISMKEQTVIFHRNKPDAAKTKDTPASTTRRRL